MENCVTFPRYKDCSTYFGPVEGHQHGDHGFRDLGIGRSRSGERRELLLVGRLSMGAKLKNFAKASNTSLIGFRAKNEEEELVSRVPSKSRICIGFLGWSVTRLESGGGHV